MKTDIQRAVDERVGDRKNTRLRKEVEIEGEGNGDGARRGGVEKV